MAPKLILRFCRRNPGPAYLDGDQFHDKMAVLAVTFAHQPSDCWEYWESRLYLSIGLNRTLAQIPRLALQRPCLTGAGHLGIDATAAKAAIGGICLGVWHRS